MKNTENLSNLQTSFFLSFVYQSSPYPPGLGGTLLRTQEVFKTVKGKLGLEQRAY